VVPSVKALRPQFQVHAFDEVMSTNQILWEMAKQGAQAGTVVIAQRQTAGRGQRGKAWVSSLGGIYLSVLLEVDWDSVHASRLTFTSAWGIATLLQQWQLPIQIKWPNDLVFLAMDRPGQLLKMGGILTESCTTGRRLRQAVVGVGLNYANIPPDDVEANSSGLRRCAAQDDSLPGAIDLQTLLAGTPARSSWSIELAADTVLMGIWQGLCWQQQVGNTQFMQAYGKLLAHLGQTVEVGGIAGQIIGVTERGQLQVTVPLSTSGENIILLSTQQVSLSYNNAGLNHIV